MMEPVNLAAAGTAGTDAEPPERVAARGLESFFWRQLLSEARATSPGLLDGGFAGDTFRSMLDDALADQMSQAGVGLADTFEAALGGDPSAVGDDDGDGFTVDADEYDRAIGAPPQPRAAHAGLELAEHPGPVHFVAPALGRYSSPFGERIHPVTHQKSFHDGLDIAAPAGAPVGAAAAGTVIQAGPTGTYGNLVAVRHADGTETRYAHLATIGVRKGDAVAAGQPLGTVGATGRVTGPHLHFEVREGGHAVDPAPLIPRGSGTPE